MKKLIDLTDTEINYWMCVKDGYEKVWIVKTNPKDRYGTCYARNGGRDNPAFYLAGGSPKLSTMLEDCRASLCFKKVGKGSRRWVAALSGIEVVGDSPAHALCLLLLREEYGEEIREVPSKDIVQEY